MKKKIFKTLTGVALSLVVATTAVVGVSAAVQPRYAMCTHGSETDYYYYEYTCANSTYHWAQQYKETVCNYCGEILDKHVCGGELYLQHDLSGYSNGNWVCVDCGYEETPGRP